MKYSTIFINGQAFNCSKSVSLKDLLIYLDFDVDLVAIEYNKEILDNSRFDSIFPKSQDNIEIITIVGGG
uniref:thiamine biosynthesis protein ThiS n=1 Tax=Polyopes affinis TaxID=194519 RepID=UPI002A826ABE|nr:thiamine biosynthesis protein ThiS [Polyopes affinis]WOL37017.1 thiamine biosynthesis protein ThiS [Polyopes affinis]